MKVLVDTNIWLDIALKRAPHVVASVQAVNLLDTAAHNAFVCAHSITTIFYLVEKASDRSSALAAVDALLSRTSVAPVDGAILRNALSSDFSDYEDAVIDRSAEQAGVDAIVTRNTQDFTGSRLAIYTPRELVAVLNA